MKYSHVFWDWNGTLLDDACVAFSAVNAMLASRSLKSITFEQYREYIDVPIIKFYERVMDVSAESMDALSVEFHSLCEQFSSKEPLFSDAREVLHRLSSLGIKQYIFSSSQNKVILPMLERCGIADCFVSVLGASDCLAASKVERTRSYLINNGISPDSAVFIGDMVHDSEVASAIGSDCVLVPNGHQSEYSLRQTGRPVVSSLSAVADIIQS